MDPIIAQFIKLGLTAFFTEMKLQGKSDEEIDAIFQQSKQQFFSNDPLDLPDV